jgi:predicted phosphoribosyltransferase
MFRFTDHKSAGELLGTVLDDYADRTDVVVLALRRSATEVARAVAATLQCPFAFEEPPVIPLFAFDGLTVILVHDGFASAAELNELVFEARCYRPARLIVAAPVVSSEAAAKARKSTDASAFLAMPSPFNSVGYWYEDSMREAREVLFVGRNRARRRDRAMAS